MTDKRVQVTLRLSAALHQKLLAHKERTGVPTQKTLERAAEYFLANLAKKR